MSAEPVDHIGPPKKKPMGRPTLYTLELAKELCKRIASSPDGLRTICAADEMPCESSVYVWLYEYPDFMELYARARKAQGEIFAQDTIHIADKAGLTHEEINKAKLRIDTRKWAASKLDPKKYGDSTILRGDKDNPIDIGLAGLLDSAASRRAILPAILPAIEGEATHVQDMPAITQDITIPKA